MPVYPGYVLAVVASLTVGKPVKWIEDRSENLQADSFARDYHIHAELAATKDGKITGAEGQDHRRPRLHGRRGRPVEVPGRPVQRHHRLVRLPERVRRGRRRLHEQAARRRRLPLLVPGDRGRPRHRADGRHPRPRDRQGPGRSCGWRTSSSPTSSRTRRRPAGRTTRATTRRALQKAMDTDRLRRPAQGAGREARSAASSWASASAASPRSSGPGRRTTSTSSASRCSTRARSGSIRPARCWPGSASRRRARATRRHSPRSSPRSSASRSQDIKIEYGDTDTAPYGLGTYASRSTPVAGAATAIASRKIQDKARKLAAHLLEAIRGRPRVGARQVQRQGLAGPVQDDPGDRVRGVHQPPGRGWRPASRRSTTTTRRT